MGTLLTLGMPLRPWARPITVLSPSCARWGCQKCLTPLNSSLLGSVWPLRQAFLADATSWVRGKVSVLQEGNGAGQTWVGIPLPCNPSPHQFLSVFIPPPRSLSLSLSLSLTHTHTHTHTYTELPKGKKPALRVQTPDPEDSSLQGCSQQLEGLRFPRGNPPALLPPASCRADGPHPGPMFPGSRPHPFLPAQGGGGWGGLRLPAYPRLLVWKDCPLPARLPVALGGIQSSSTGSMNPPVAVAFELPLTDVRGRMCRLVAQLRPTLCDPSRASLSVGFSRREYWRGWPLPSPGRGRMVASKTSTPKPWIL